MIGVGTRWVYVSLPGTSVTASLNTPTCIDLYAISRSKPNLGIRSQFLLNIWLIDPPNVRPSAGRVGNSTIRTLGKRSEVIPRLKQKYAAGDHYQGRNKRKPQFRSTQ